MSIEEAKRLYKYGEKQYDELTDEQKKFVDNYWEAVVNLFAKILTVKPYKAKLPPFTPWCDTNKINWSSIKLPPRNYREEHGQFIERLIYIQGEKDKRIDVTSMYPRIRRKSR